MAFKDVRKIGSPMNKSEADAWVEKYKKEHPISVNPTYGWLYGADALETLLGYEGAEGIWFFKGLNEAGEERLVLYAADKDGKIIGDSTIKGGAEDGEPLPFDDGVTCPPDCP